jgi:hypothetical protein
VVDFYLSLQMKLQGVINLDACKHDRSRLTKEKKKKEEDQNRLNCTCNFFLKVFFFSLGISKTMQVLQFTFHGKIGLLVSGCNFERNSVHFMAGNLRFCINHHIF